MYTTILHPLRKAMNLSMHEYAVLDCIYHLSNNTKFGGWAIITKQRIADDLDLSKQSILNIIDSLIIKGFVIKEPTTKYLRASEFYCNAIQNKSNWIVASTENEQFISGKESLPLVNNLSQDGKENIPSSVKKLYHDGKKTLPNNNSNNNINNNSNNKSIIPNFDEFLEYAKTKEPNVDSSDLKLKYDSWLESDWSINRSGKYQKIVYWKSTLLNTLPYIKKLTVSSGPQKAQRNQYL
jgi:hypothetical protein